MTTHLRAPMLFVFSMLAVIPSSTDAFSSTSPLAKQRASGAIEHVLLPSVDDPIVSLRVLFRAGSRLDPAGREGVTMLAARVMAEATRSHTSAALDAALFPWAGEISVETDKETTVFIGRVHRDHADRFLSLFLQILQNPRFDVVDFERVRERQLSELTKSLRHSHHELLAREVLELELYERPLAPLYEHHTPSSIGVPSNLQVRHPYRHTPRGTEHALTALTLDEVKTHARHAFARERAVLGMAGGFEPRHADLMLAALSALPSSTEKPAPLPPPPAIPGRSLLIIDKPAHGTTISLGFHVAVNRRHADYAALKIAEAWFGEHRSRVGFLFDAMRERRGLNSGDYSYAEHFVQDGEAARERLQIGREQQYFSMWIRPVEHKNRHFALRQAVFELERFVEQGIPDDDSFARVQSHIAGSWAIREAEPMRRLGYALDDVFYRVPDGRNLTRARIAALSRAEVNAAIRRHLQAERLRIVAVTSDGAAFAKAIVEERPSPIVYPAAMDERTRDEDERIQVYPLKLKDAVRVIPPVRLFER